MRRVAMLSVHTSPMAALGGKDTGGMNVYVRELSRHLGARGLEVDVYTRRQSPTEERVREMERNVRVIHLRAGPEEPCDRSLLFPHLPEFVSEWNEYTYHEGLEYDLVHSHYWLSGWVGRELARARVLPIVQMFHTLGYGKDIVAPGAGNKAPSTRIEVERELVRDVDRIIAATPEDEAQMVEYYDADPRKVTIIPLGVDLALFRPISRRDAMRAIGIELPPQPHLILFVGRLDPFKGLDVLFEALCRLRELEPELGRQVCLAVIGGDADEDHTRMAEQLECMDRLKSESGITDLVVFLGSRAQNTLPFYYSAADVCVVPSHYESFGLVALEAMACGVPVIASRVGGLQYTVQDGVNGFLVPPGDADALAAKLKQVLGDSEVRQRLAANARQRAEQFTWDSVAYRIIQVYEGLCQQSQLQYRPSSKNRGQHS